MYRIKAIITARATHPVALSSFMFPEIHSLTIIIAIGRPMMHVNIIPKASEIKDLPSFPILSGDANTNIDTDRNK